MGNVLTVDIGNTNIAICLWNEAGETRLEKIPTRRDYSEGELKVAFLSALRSLNNKKAEPVMGSVISCVVPAIADIAVKVLTSVTGRAPLVVNSDLPCGIDLDDYDKRSLGAVSIYGAPVIICDLGTCTTISVINSDKRLIGGMICPGVQMSLDALHERVPHLPQITASMTDSVIGSDTASSILTGAVVGCANMISETAAKVSQLPGMGNASLVLTGGSAPMVLPHIERDAHYEPDLLMKGLFELYTNIC